MSETPETNDAGSELADQITTMSDQITKSVEEIADLNKTIEDLKKVREDQPNAMEGFNIRTGENIMESRPYSILKVAQRLRMAQDGGDAYKGVAKQEAELSDELNKHYCGRAQWKDFNGHFVVPLDHRSLPLEDKVTDEGDTIPAVPGEIVQKCKDMMQLGQRFDPEQIVYLEKNGVNLPLNRTGIQKDMSAQTATTGGTFVAEAAQGELINVLSAMSVMDQVGAQTLTLPPQGSISFPRVTSTVTVTAQSEGATVTESTPATSALILQAKPYSGLTDVPEELFKFASVNVEAWLRGEFIRELALKRDRDSINGAGGIAINGIVNMSGITTRLASTVAADGNTLGKADLTLLQGDLSVNNVDVDDSTFFYALRGNLFSAFATRSSSSPFEFSHAFNMLNAGTGGKSLNGQRVVCSSQIPADRSKGASSTLTLVLAGVGREYINANSGVVDVAMTNSDASKFQTRISTLRATLYCDGGAMHESAFGFIDTLLTT